MLDSLSEDLRGHYYRHAEECAQRAASQKDPRLRQDFLELARRWLSLAYSSELAERLDTGPESEVRADDR